MKNIIFSSFLAIALSATAQEKTNKKGSEYVFTTIKNLDATAVQNQNMTGTCWSFSSLSFLESEMIRMGKGKEYNLSEMFIARKAYPLKADNYLRMHGRTNLGEGGGFPDALHIVKHYGLVPEEVYTGKKDTSEQHNHKLLETTLKNILKPALEENDKIDFEFLHNSVEAICDAYLGKAPEKFTYKGKEYTPKSFAATTGIVPDDYVILSSFSHHPFYSKFVLEVPDNWLWEQVYNLPLNELQEVMRESLNKGFTFAWAADVSERGFMFKDGIAVVPKNKEDLKVAGSKPVEELQINQENRQKAFDNYLTQDDHGMHIVGNVKDQKGTMYYLVKNSWGRESNECDGYFYASENYVLYKTTSILLHKKALPSGIAKKLGISQ